MFNVQCSMFNVQCSMLDMLLLIVMLQESLFNVGPANPNFSLKTRGGDLNLGFEVVSPFHHRDNYHDDLDHHHGH